MTCPSREQLGSLLLDALDPELAAYFQFHLDVVECPFCQANLDDLKAQSAGRHGRQGLQVPPAPHPPVEPAPARRREALSAGVSGQDVPMRGSRDGRPMSRGSGPFLAWPGRALLVRTLWLALPVSAWWVLVYHGANGLTGAAHRAIAVHLDAERAMPFVPPMILAYLSIDLVFLPAPFVLRSRRELEALALSLAAAIAVAGVGSCCCPRSWPTRDATRVPGRACSPSRGRGPCPTTWSPRSTWR